MEKVQERFNFAPKVQKEEKEERRTDKPDSLSKLRREGKTVPGKSVGVCWGRTDINEWLLCGMYVCCTKVEWHG